MNKCTCRLMIKLEQKNLQTVLYLVKIVAIFYNNLTRL